MSCGRLRRFISHTDLSENHVVLTEVDSPRTGVAERTVSEPKTLVVNFNCPELGFLASWLAQRGRGKRCWNARH
jgi:hypothetical protein